MAKQSNPKQIGLYVAILILIPVLFLTYANTIQQPATSQPTRTANVGLSALYVWDIGNPTTLLGAENSANYSLIVPTFVPTGASLTQVRYSADSNFVLLAYKVVGVSALDGSANPGGWGLLITEQVSVSNPLPPQTTIVQPVIEKIKYSNGTSMITTIAQSSTVTSDWQDTAVSGQSVLIQSGSAEQFESGIQWWSHGIWYQAFANFSLPQLEQVAASMISSSAIINS
jgi:hypothetical protein